MDDADIAIVLGIILGTAVPIVLGMLWYNARRRLKELETRLRLGDPVSDDRVDALARQVEGLAEQLDQVASGQEFLNRLIARQLERPQAQPPLVVTPH